MTQTLLRKHRLPGIWRPITRKLLTINQDSALILHEGHNLALYLGEHLHFEILKPRHGPAHGWCFPDNLARAVEGGEPLLHPLQERASAYMLHHPCRLWSTAHVAFGRGQCCDRRKFGRAQPAPKNALSVKISGGDHN